MLTQHQTGNIINQRYQIISVLGKGGIGTTYEAQNLDTKAIVAIKTISLRRITDAKQLELLEREVEVLKKLNHPGIPQYLDYFEIDSNRDRIFYIVQQLAPGKTLDEWVKLGWRVTEAEVKQVTAQILKILDYLHGFNPPIIHRDIKPHNLIRSPEGKLFLVDFGAVQNAYYSTFMGGSTTVGTFGYMPLEQAGGKAVPASDLYSLGATLVYLLTHRSPSELSADGLSLDFRSYIQLSEEFADWLEKILEPETESRFNSAKEALTALNNPKLVREGRLNKKRWLAWLGLGVGSVAGVMLFYSYKWTILNSLGYPPPMEVCREKEVTRDYLLTGGKLPIIHVAKCFDWAIDKHYDNIVELLISKGFNVNVENNYGDSPLHSALRSNNKYIVELLVAKANVNVRDGLGYTPLHLAIKKGDKNLVKLLISKGADVNSPTDGGSTPLDWALDESNKDLVELLIANGATVNVNRSYEKLLNWAGKHGYKDIVGLLIAKGADVNAQEFIYKETPLHWVAEGGYKDLVELLIANGADVNVKNKNGDTPLLLAARKEHKDIVELLKKHGAK